MQVPRVPELLLERLLGQDPAVTLLEAVAPLRAGVRHEHARRRRRIAARMDWSSAMTCAQLVNEHQQQLTILADVRFACGVLDCDVERESPHESVPADQPKQETDAP